MKAKRRPNTKKINDSNYVHLVTLHLKGYTNEQIALVLNCSISTVSRMKKYYKDTYKLEYRKEK